MAVEPLPIIPECRYRGSMAVDAVPLVVDGCYRGGMAVEPLTLVLDCILVRFEPLHNGVTRYASVYCANIQGYVYI